uniref:Uncharacterized protein n=1 Tax=Arundo donax TaxID=35708 RepID=A0A0A8Z1R3_ARUDO
MVTVLRFP